MIKAKDNLKGIFMEAQESDIKYFAMKFVSGKVVIHDMKDVKIIGYFCADSFEAIERALK